MCNREATNKEAADEELAVMLGLIGVPDGDPVPDLNHLTCPFHDDSTGSLSVWRAREGGWLWKCHAGCGAGSLYSLIKKSGGKGPIPCRTRRAAPPKVAIPIPDPAELMTYTCNGGICGRDAIQLLTTRRITRQVAEYYSINRSGRYWSIPIPSPNDDSICAVKLHAVHPGTRPKCMWAPIGTVPAERPVHGISTLYPRPENWTPCVRLFILPGELKALRMISLGHQAVSPTAGEGFEWPERELRRLRGFRCTVLYDDDPAGILFKDRTMRALREQGIPCMARTAGRKGQ